jgi:hypothetical protein
MKKQEYKIITLDGVKTKTGYIYGYRGYFFGVSGSTNHYEVTELTTGGLLPITIKKLSDVAEDLSKWVDEHASSLNIATSGKYARFTPTYTEYEAILTARNRR